MTLEFIWNSFIKIWSLIRKGGSSNGNGCWSLTFYVEMNSDRKKQMALEFIWNSFIIVSSFHYCRLLEKEAVQMAMVAGH